MFMVYDIIIEEFIIKKTIKSRRTKNVPLLVLQTEWNSPTTL